MLGTSDLLSGDSEAQVLSSAGQNEAASSYCRSHRMSITQVATHGWLIRHEPRAGRFSGLIACVEERDSRFELMEIGGGFHWTTFTTFRDALTHLAAQSEFPTVAPVIT